MIEHRWLFIALTFFAALCCLGLLKNLIAKRAPKEFLLLFGNLATMNLMQGLGYAVWATSPILGKLFADLYLISAYFFFTHLLLFSFGLSKNPLKGKKWALAYCYPALLTVLHAAGFMVENYRIEQNSLMHNDGPLAGLFDIYVLLCCTGSAAVFTRNIKSHRGNKILCSKNFIGLFSFLPLILVFVVIILLSLSDYAIAVGIISPMITVYTAYAYYYLSRDSVVDLSIGVGFFFDRLKIAYLLLETHKSKSDLKTYHKEVEKQFIIEALKEHDYRIYDAADFLGYNHTTLRNKIKEYDISLETELTAQTSN